MLPPGLARLAISPTPTRSLVLATIGIVRVAAFAARAAADPGDDNARLVPDQLRRHLGQPLVIALGEAVIEADGAAIDIAGAASASRSSPDVSPSVAGVSIRKATDHRQLSLSCASAGTAAQNQTAKAAQTCFIR